MYRIIAGDGIGNQRHWSDLSTEEISTVRDLMGSMIPTPSGCFIEGFSAMAPKINWR